MSSFSVQTEHLADVASYFSGEARQLQSSVDGKLRSLEISADAFPAACRDSASGYEDMRSALARLLPTLHDVVAVIGTGLTAAATNYETCEQQNGQNFTYDAHGNPGKLPS